MIFFRIVFNSLMPKVPKWTDTLFALNDLKFGYES